MKEELKAAILNICHAWAALKLAEKNDDSNQLRSGRARESLDDAIIRAERLTRGEG